jgi:hypothetical protein
MEMFAAGGVFEAQFRRVQRQARCLTAVVEYFTAGLSCVDFVAANGMTGFRKVYANLVRSAGLEPARKQGVARQLFFKGNVCDGYLAHFRKLRTAAAAIAAVGNEVRFDRPGRKDPRHHCQVFPHHRVFAELLPKFSFRQSGTREYHQATGLLVETMDNPETR